MAYVGQGIVFGLLCTFVDSVGPEACLPLMERDEKTTLTAIFHPNAVVTLPAVVGFSGKSSKVFMCAGKFLVVLNSKS